LEKNDYSNFKDKYIAIWEKLKIHKSYIYVKQQISEILLARLLHKFFLEHGQLISGQYIKYSQ